MDKKNIMSTDGRQYIPYEKRSGNESIVYFTRDLSAEGLRKIYRRVSGSLIGKVGIKLHTGEKNGPNIIPRDWVERLIREELPEAAIIETNTYYEGDRYTTELHRETLRVNGWTFCPVDIMDAEGTAMLPVKDGKWFSEMSMEKNLLTYDSMLALTHFKGHTKGGFGGSNKNIGSGCADGRIGKAMIHTTPGSEDMWDISNEEFMERMETRHGLWQLFWGGGVTIFSVIIGHLGNDAVAANSLANIVKNILGCVSKGVGTAGAILVGNELGKNQIELAKKYAKHSTIVAGMIGMITCLLILVIRPLILHFSHLTGTATTYLSGMLLISSYYAIAGSVNNMVIGGIFCAGGKSKFGCICDGIVLWLIVIPMASLSAFYFHLPVLAVYFILCLDECIKVPVVFWYYRKYTWAQNLTEQ